jgi:hypothetical protein
MAKRDDSTDKRRGSSREDNGERRVIDLNEADENAGVEDTPYNAPEETEARERLAWKGQPSKVDERPRQESKE